MFYKSAKYLPYYALLCFFVVVVTVLHFLCEVG